MVAVDDEVGLQVQTNQPKLRTGNYEPTPRHLFRRRVLQSSRLGQRRILYLSSAAGMIRGKSIWKGPQRCISPLKQILGPFVNKAK